MKDDERALEQGGLRFFGKVSASLSHEIKNVLAIIGESSGLMEDLLAIHRNKGAALDPQRLQTIAERIRKHVSRGDAIVKNMNRFAHSADEPIQVKDLGELSQLVVNLAQRHAMLRGVTLAFSSVDAAVPIETNPFLLLQFLWNCIDLAVQACSPSKKVNIHVDRAENGGEVALGGLELSDSGMNGILSRESETLMEELGIQLSVSVEDQLMRLFVPARVSRS